MKIHNCGCTKHFFFPTENNSADGVQILVQQNLATPKARSQLGSLVEISAFAKETNQQDIWPQSPSTSLPPCTARMDGASVGRGWVACTFRDSGGWVGISHEGGLTLVLTWLMADVWGGEPKVSSSLKGSKVTNVKCISPEFVRLTADWWGSAVVESPLLPPPPSPLQLPSPRPRRSCAAAPP